MCSDVLVEKTRRAAALKTDCSTCNWALGEVCYLLLINCDRSVAFLVALCTIVNINILLLWVSICDLLLLHVSMISVDLY